MPWDEAGSAPNNNIAGRDPGLQDPEYGDYRPDGAVEYGSRIVPDPSTVMRHMQIERLAGSTPTSTLGATRGGMLSVGGEIVEDTLWDAATILVTADVVVTSGAVLTVAPGVTVEFEDYYGVLIRDGALQAAGSPLSPITWTTDEPASFDETQDDHGCWNGITFLNVPAANAPSYLQWCVLEYAKSIPGRGLDDDVPRVGGQAYDGAGGAVRIVGGAPVEIAGCTLRHNCADRGGALAVHYSAAPILSNCLFMGNVGWSRAGAVFASYSRPYFIHDTLTLNRSVNPEIYDRTAAAVDHFHSAPLYVGCVIHGNTTNHHDHDQLLDPHAYDVLYCDVEDYGLGVGGMDLDPRLTSTGDISDASPCRDMGNVDVAAAWLSDVDMAGRPRVHGAEIDMGCYEFNPPTTVATMPYVLSVSAWPNPANPFVTIRWSSFNAGRMQLVVYDLAGRRVRVLLDEARGAGEHSVRWDGTDASGRSVAAGVYRVRAVCPGGDAAVSVLLVR